MNKEPRSIHWFLGLCAIKGTTGVVCYVSNGILKAVHSNGPQFQTGPDLSWEVSPSGQESYVDLNSWIRINIQLWLKDKQPITQSVFLHSSVCPPLVSIVKQEIGDRSKTLKPSANHHVSPADHWCWSLLNMLNKIYEWMTAVAW